MTTKFFLRVIIVAVALTTASSWGEEKPLTLFDTKWKLEGFFNAETETLEVVDRDCCSEMAEAFGDDHFYTIDFFSEEANKAIHDAVPPDLYPDDYVQSYIYCGHMAGNIVNGSYIADYKHSTFIRWGVPLRSFAGDTKDGDRYFNNLLAGCHAFELTENSLKLYCGDKNDYLQFNPWVPKGYVPWIIPNVSIATQNREIPPTVSPTETADVAVAVSTIPAVELTGKITAAPNPVPRSAGAVDFYRDGSVFNATLKIYDASGKFVRKVQVSGNATLGNQNQPRRKVASWDMKDAKGRTVAAGTYLVKGTVKAPDGKRERVSLLIGVR